MKHSRILLAAVSLLILFAGSEHVYAGDGVTEMSEVYYSVDIEDPALEDATLISTNSYIENDRQITETVYILPDGNTITDVWKLALLHRCLHLDQIRLQEPEQ